MKQFAAGNGIGHTIQVAVCQPVNGRVAARLFSVGLRLSWDESRGLQKKFWSHENRRSYLDGQTGAERACYEAPGPCVKVRVDGLCKAGCFGRMGGYPVAPFHLRELRERMGLYTPLEVLAARGCELDAVRMWSEARKHPKAEYLVKLGLYRLAVAELVGASVLREKGKSVAQLLGVPGGGRAGPPGSGPGAGIYGVYPGLLNCGVRVTGQDMKDISGLALALGRSEDAAVHDPVRDTAQSIEICENSVRADKDVPRWGPCASYLEGLQEHGAGPGQGRGGRAGGPAQDVENGPR